jgi:hypothetical protein
VGVRSIAAIVPTRTLGFFGSSAANRPNCGAILITPHANATLSRYRERLAALPPSATQWPASARIEEHQ